MASRSEVGNLRLHKSDDLCQLAEMLGYKETGRFAINQLQCNNGAFVSSLLRLLDDNPDLMETMREWVLENCELDEEDEDEVESEEPEAQP
jgi:hypothetical protein